MRKALASALFATAIILIVRCTTDQEVIEPPVIPEQCDTSTVTYDNYIKNVIDTKCATSGCHNGSQFPDLSTYAGVKANADNGRIKARAIDNNPSAMPPGTPLPQSTKDSIQDWIDQGACETNQ